MPTAYYSLQVLNESKLLNTLMGARMDSCLFNKCPADDLTEDNTPTWAGGCAAQDGVAHVQTTDIDFTKPGSAGRAPAKRGHSARRNSAGGPHPKSPASSRHQENGGTPPPAERKQPPPVERKHDDAVRVERLADPGSSGTGNGSGPGMAHGAPEGPTSTGAPRARAAGERLAPAEHGAALARGAAETMIDGLQHESAAAPASTALSSKMMNAATMSLSTLVVLAFAALVMRVTMGRRRQRRGVAM